MLLTLSCCCCHFFFFLLFFVCLFLLFPKRKCKFSYFGVQYKFWVWQESLAVIKELFYILYISNIFYLINIWGPKRKGLQFPKFKFPCNNEEKVVLNFCFREYNFEILQLRAKFQTAMVSCSRFIRITNSSDHRRVWILLYTK